MSSTSLKELKFIGESGIDCGELYIGDPRIFDSDGREKLENTPGDRGIVIVKDEKGIVCGVSIQATGGDGSCPIYFTNDKLHGVVVGPWADYDPCNSKEEIIAQSNALEGKIIEPMTVKINSDCLWIGDPGYLYDDAEMKTIFSAETKTWATYLSSLRALGHDSKEPMIKCYNYKAGHQGLGTLIMFADGTDKPAESSTITIKIFFGQHAIINHLEFYVDK